MWTSISPCSYESCSLQSCALVCNFSKRYDIQLFWMILKYLFENFFDFMTYFLVSLKRHRYFFHFAIPWYPIEFDSRRVGYMYVPINLWPHCWFSSTFVLWSTTLGQISWKKCHYYCYQFRCLFSLINLCSNH